MDIHKRLAAEVDEAEAEITAMNTEETNAVEPEMAGESEAQNTPETQESTETEVESTQSEQDADPDKDWKAESELYKQRFKVLQGKYNAELPREKARGDAAEARLEEISTQADGPDDGSSEFDEEYPDIAAGVDSKVDPLSKDVKYLKEKDIKREQKSAQEAHSNMLNKLTELQPDWALVNESAEFLKWLSEYDPQTGIQRQARLNESESAMDAHGIADVINEWKATQLRKQAPRPDLQRKITPSNAAGAEVPQGKRTYTRRDAEAFIEGRNPSYLKKAGGGMDAQQFERELFAAEVEGRLI